MERSKSEFRLYSWLSLQRSRIWTGSLPEKFVAALQDAHPLLSETVAVAQSKSLNKRHVGPNNMSQTKLARHIGAGTKLANANGDAIPVMIRYE